ncbi:hypothetical protein [Catenulispora pinisilvae]|uniref:hypothetical protein n=1 Tax=Catenulispora pinisilvae TaxID=2705253 RepID=UPI001E61ACFB|nr:hypothetical protein [Catenulispora pinisilvae]
MIQFGVMPHARTTAVPSPQPHDRIPGGRRRTARDGDSLRVQQIVRTLRAGIGIWFGTDICIDIDITGP